MKQSETNIVALAKALIERASVTPKDEDCQILIAERLKKMGFTIYHLPFENVNNLFAIRLGTRENINNMPIFAFAGHTDVVPPGPLTHWRTPPFSPSIDHGLLYGRGAADMKGSIAAIVCSFENFLKKYPEPNGRLALILTSDEEGPAHHGTKRVMEYLKDQGIFINYCIVGEPSSKKQLGDNIKIGRRGSMSGHLKIHGVQGHIAYPHKATNSIHLAMKPLIALIEQTWDQGNQHFPPTSFQISNILAGTGAGNVIPGVLDCHFNFRFSNEQTAETLQAIVASILDRHSVNYDLVWEISGHPFLAVQGKLLSATTRAIEELLNIKPELTTDGGTSDARFIAPAGGEVIELGPCNHTIHQVNECISIEELNQLSILYEKILENLLVN